MLKFFKSVKEYNREIYQPAFNIIKMYRDKLNSGDIQSFLDEYVDKLWRGRVCKILSEGGIDIFPKQENYICENCLEGNDLIEIKVPSHIEIIGSYCFAYSMLEKISFAPGSELRILGFGSLQGTNIKEITLPKGFQHFDGLVFDSCYELSVVTIPNTLQSIGSGVFKNCSKLTKLFYEGGVEDFNQIYKDKNWLSGSSIKRINCLDGIISV